MSYCTRCGREVPAGGSFCPSCGAAATPPPPGGSFPGPREPGISDAEWRDFLGPKADFYLERFPGFTVGNVTSFSVTWNWPAFFCSFWWFLYRKLYLPALAVFVSVFVPYLNLAAWIAVPMAANYVYFLEGRKRIAALKEANGGAPPPGTLARVGGVNGWVWIVAIVVTAVALALGAGCLLVVGTALRGSSV